MPYYGKRLISFTLRRAHAARSGYIPYAAVYIRRRHDRELQVIFDVHDREGVIG